MAEEAAAPATHQDLGNADSTQSTHTDILPPWTEASAKQRFRLGFYYSMVYLPVVILLFVISSSYPVYVFLYVWPTALGGDDRPELYYWHSHAEHVRARVIGSVCWFLSTLFLVMFVCSFYQAFSTSPGDVPSSEDWTDVRNAERLALKEKKHSNGGTRQCRRCIIVKPDRCHHCRLCDRCVLKMDHHCPWIANCVGFFNYKYFFLMLTYGMLGLWLFEGTFWETVLITWRDDERGAGASFTVTSIFFLFGILMSAVTLFWSFHVYLMVSGLTTIEYCEKKKKTTKEFKAPYYGSTYEALQGALGKDPWKWPSPFSYREPEEDGLGFSQSSDQESVVTLEAAAPQ